MALKRSAEIIIAEILEVCVAGACKTSIVYKTNLNFKTASPYIDKLTSRGLLQITYGNKMVYTTSEQGRIMLKSLKSIQKDIPELCFQVQ